VLSVLYSALSVHPLNSDTTYGDSNAQCHVDKR